MKKLRHTYSIGKRTAATAAMALLLSASAWADGTAEAAGPVLDSGNTAWMITATTLVLLMSIPGIALFYGAAESVHLARADGEVPRERDEGHAGEADAGGQQVQKVLPLLGGEAALAVVHEGLHKGPVAVPVHILPEVVGHVVEGGRLGLLLRADPGVGGAAQGDAVDIAGLFDQVPQLVNIHVEIRLQSQIAVSASIED